ncbi:MAG TPA: GAF domain-containing sensor histidine kinase, partial [Anaerolineales bacterium]|nr:GAF domain-containing sensor histidine kinase [Anaerolineales bacterium]
MQGSLTRSELVVPIAIQGKVLGVLDVQSQHLDDFEPTDVDLMQAIASQTGVAIENARLFAETQRLLKETEQRANKLMIVNNVQQQLASKLEVQSIYELVGDTFRDLFDAQVVMISTYDPETDTIQHRYAIERGERVYSPGTYPPGGFRAEIIRTKQPMLVNTGVAEEARRLWQPTLPGTVTPKSWLGVPILVNDQVTGILSVQNLDRENAFDQSDVHLLQTFAASMSIALENARLFSQAERRAEQFRVLTEVSQHLISLTALDELLGNIVRTVKEAFGYLNVGIGLVEGNEVVSRAEAGAFEEKYHSVRVPLGHGVWGWVAQNGRSLISDQMDADWNHEHFAQEGIHSHVCVPLKLKNTVIGVMSADSNRVGAFDRSDEIILQTLANQASVAIDNVRLYEKEKQVAILEERQRLGRELHDSVTQSLYGISLYAQAALGKLAANQPDQTRQYLVDIQNTAQESLADMRLLIFELRPPILDKEGLISALENRLSAVENRAKIKSSIRSNLTGRLPSEVEQGLYQIAREALNNVVKHSFAKNVFINVEQDPATVSMEIRDDGIGFDAETACRKGCLGLANIQDRARAQGWQLELESSPGNGARIKVEIRQP